MNGSVAVDGILVAEPWLTPEAYRDGQLRFRPVDLRNQTLATMYVQRRVGRRSIEQMHLAAGTAAEGIEHQVEQVDVEVYTHGKIRSAMVDAGLKMSHAQFAIHGYGVWLERHGAPRSAADEDAISNELGRLPAR